MLVERYPPNTAPNLYIELFLKAPLAPTYQKRMEIFQKAGIYVNGRQEKAPFEFEDFFQRLI
jgi:hypothetical protein